MIFDPIVIAVRGWLVVAIVLLPFNPLAGIIMLALFVAFTSAAGEFARKVMRG